jgi:hypothetical protein
LSSVVIGEGKIGLPDGFVMSERMRKVAAKRGLDRGSTKALFVKFCAYYRGNGAEHDGWEKTWAGWVRRQYVKVGSRGRKRWEKSERDNIVTMRSILARKRGPSSSDAQW